MRTLSEVEEGSGHRISRFRVRAPISCQSPQNGEFIKTTELARRLFVGKAKPFFVLKLTRTCLLHKETVTR